MFVTVDLDIFDCTSGFLRLSGNVKRQNIFFFHHTFVSSYSYLGATVSVFDCR
jgi:hypothetical protein